MSKSVPQLTEKTDREADDLFHIVRNDVDYKQKRSSILPLRKTYKALVTQVGTGNPTVVVLENSVGSVTWARTGVGSYYATLTGAFPLAKTAISFGIGDTASATAGYILARDTTEQPDKILFVTIAESSGLASDDILYSTLITIEVYP